MRKLVIGLLLGAAMTGAPAAAQRWQERGQGDADRTQPRMERREAQSEAAAPRDEAARRDRAAPAAERGPRPDGGPDRGRLGPAARGPGETPPPAVRPNGQGADARVDGRDWQRDRAGFRGDRPGGPGWQGERPDLRDGRGDRPGARDWQAGRPGSRDGRDDRPAIRDGRPVSPQWRDDRRGDADRFGRDRYRDAPYRGVGVRGDGRWDRGWRQDRRYDWQTYRAGNRNLYRAPRYYAPRGYAGGYRRWSPGFRLEPFFYAQSYWISDPFYYRLPPAYGPYRWVRYYGDVLLIDVRNGEVVDAIYDFFW